MAYILASNVFLVNLLVERYCEMFNVHHMCLDSATATFVNRNRNNDNDYDDDDPILA